MKAFLVPRMCSFEFNTALTLNYVDPHSTSPKIHMVVILYRDFSIFLPLDKHGVDLSTPSPYPHPPYLRKTPPLP